MVEKTSYRGYTAAQNKATQKYHKENLEQINFRVKKGEKQQYIDAAKKLGLTIADFFTSAAQEKIKKELREEREKPE